MVDYSPELGLDGRRSLWFMGRELKNEFSWSKTRDETFRECLRKYYFQYYGSWFGWERDADPRTRQIYILKNLQTRQMWAGDHVHRAIEDILGHLRRGAELPMEEAAVAKMLDAMRQDFRDSRSGKYRDQPKRTCGLFEHEYAVKLPDEAWKENADHAAQCLRNFYASEILQRGRALPQSAWLQIEERSAFLLDGIKVFVQLDFAFSEGDQIVVYDWKTGRAAAKNDVQLACYVLYAVDKWKVAPDRVAAVEFNLQTKTETRHQVDAEKLESVKDHIRDSADEMQFPLSDPEQNLAEEESFDFTEDEHACKRCNFVKVCPKWV